MKTWAVIIFISRNFNANPILPNSKPIWGTGTRRIRLNNKPKKIIKMENNEYSFVLFEAYKNEILSWETAWKIGQHAIIKKDNLASENFSPASKSNNASDSKIIKIDKNADKIVTMVIEFLNWSARSLESLSFVIENSLSIIVEIEAHTARTRIPILKEMEK